MSIVEQVQADVRASMKQRCKERTAALRLLLAELKQTAIDQRSTVEDVQAWQILQKLIRQREDAAQQYAQAGRTDLAAKECQEVDIMREYLPQPLDESQLMDLVREAVAATSSHDVRQMGQVMQYLKPKILGRAEMARVSTLVKQEIAKGSGA